MAAKKDRLILLLGIIFLVWEVKGDATKGLISDLAL